MDPPDRLANHISNRQDAELRKAIIFRDGDSIGDNHLFKNSARKPLHRRGENTAWVAQA